MQPLAGKRVAVAVGGGIAAYKAGDFVRELRRQGATVRVAMTVAAQEFMTPLSMQSLSGHAVLTELFDAGQDIQFGHLHLSRWAEVFVVLPATADLLARLAHGHANDAVTSALLAFRGPVLLAPAMNTAMWEHPATQRNVHLLRQTPQMHWVGPVSGPLADGDVGMGRLAELPDIVAKTAKLFGGQSMAGKKVLITAGPTREAVDPVRFLSNPSTGKMGLAMADEAHARGAHVTVVLGPVGDMGARPYDIVSVVSADDMLREVMTRVEHADVFVATAAVSDWRPETALVHKEEKKAQAQTLSLVRTPDILMAASTLVHSKSRRPVLVGFAAQTHEVLAYARAKLQRKKLDWIVANDVSRPGVGFGSDTNEVTLVGADGSEAEVRGSKRDVAAKLWDVVLPPEKQP